jgi:hypothetical protein
MKYLGILILAIVIFGAYEFHNSKKTEEESTRFVLESIEAISSAWDPRSFVSRADPGLVKSMNDHGGVNALFEKYSTLGKLKRAADCNLINSTTVEMGAQRYLAATYHCSAEFEGGSTMIAITVRKNEDRQAWEIYYMKIQPAHEAGLQKE